MRTRLCKGLQSFKFVIWEVPILKIYIHSHKFQSDMTVNPTSEQNFVNNFKLIKQSVNHRTLTIPVKIRYFIFQS